jgi:phosphoribosylamine--glycine ligase
MGAYSPPHGVDASLLDEVLERVLEPAVRELAASGLEYRGVLYAGLMLTPAGIRVLEFNARFGDPEAQVVLPRLDGDLIPLLEATARGALAEIKPSWSRKSSVGVVLASRGYPGSYQTGFAIDGLGTIERDVFVFHAGTAAGPGGYETAGGRVLTIVALGDSMAEARDRAYRNVERIRFEGMAYRHDLALREVESAVLQ